MPITRSLERNAFETPFVDHRFIGVSGTFETTFGLHPDWPLEQIDARVLPPRAADPVTCRVFSAFHYEICAIALHAVVRFTVEGTWRRDRSRIAGRAAVL